MKRTGKVLKLNSHEEEILREYCERNRAEGRAEGAAEEREACVVLVVRFLQFTSQRAVSWHEIQDCLEAIRARGQKKEGEK